MEERWCSPKSLTAAGPDYSIGQPRDRGRYSFRVGRPALPQPGAGHGDNSGRAEVGYRSDGKFGNGWPAPRKGEVLTIREDEDLPHILEQHKYGQNEGDETEFPSDWTDQQTLDNLNSVIESPQSVTPGKESGKAVVQGVRDGVDLRIAVTELKQGGWEVEWTPETGFPEKGDGVTWNHPVTGKKWPLYTQEDLTAKNRERSRLRGSDGGS